MIPKASRILLGHISDAQGIKGEVVVHTHTSDPEAIGSYGPLCDAEGKRTFKLTVLRVSKRGVVCRIAGVVDRNQAEALRGTELYVERQQLPEPEAEEFYHADLIGLQAIDEAGQLVGTVAAIQNFGAGDLVEIQMTGSNQSEFIPFTKACVPKIDIAGGKIMIVLPSADVDDGATN